MTDRIVDVREAVASRDRHRQGYGRHKKAVFDEVWDLVGKRVVVENPDCPDRALTGTVVGWKQGIEYVTMRGDDGEEFQVFPATCIFRVPEEEE